MWNNNKNNSKKVNKWTPFRKVKIAQSGEHTKQDLDKMIIAKQLLSMFFQ